MSAGDSCLEGQEDVVREEGAPVPVRCRRMELLGLAWRGSYYFCVHQVSVELWRLHDTPRVSVQKKIIDLGIRLLNCTREQILWLRKAGIIQNFRATMISMGDTERLYDALEQSRRKRGLQKHALKAQSLPCQRFMRAEEQRARKLHPFSDCVSPCGLPAPCPLLVAGRAETVPGMYNQWEHFIEHRIGIDAESQSAAAGFPGGSRGNASLIHASVTDTARKAERCEHANLVQSDSECSDVFIVSDSEKDSTERNGVQPQSVARAKTQSREKSAGLPPKRTAAAFRKGPLTKLCHFALQGSPRWRAEQKKGEQKRTQDDSSEHTPTLHVSIPLYKLKPNPKWTKLPFSSHRMPEKPRHTALCSFATMKRAVNSWPTTTITSTHSSTSSSCSSDSSQGAEALQAVPSRSELKAHTPPEDHSPLVITAKGQDVGKNCKPDQEGGVLVSTVAAGEGGGGGDGGGGDGEEEDVASTASYLSPSPVAVWGKKCPKGKARQSRVGNSMAGSIMPAKSTFSFEDVFGFYPPKLVVRNGQLEPAYSLSVKNSDHSVLPDSHPILKWTLGRPVRGSGGPRKARKTAAS